MNFLPGSARHLQWRSDQPGKAFGAGRFAGKHRDFSNQDSKNIPGTAGDGDAGFPENLFC
jgi:hypothetical protein